VHKDGGNKKKGEIEKRKNTECEQAIVIALLSELDSAGKE